jgi:hypothetical protein
MSHRAAVYTIAVREQRSKVLLPLGDFDGEGSYLGTCLESLFGDSFASVSDDANKVAKCTSSQLDGEDLQLFFTHGLRGVSADLIDAAGALKARQTPPDTLTISFGSLLRLPRAETLGFWTLHINSNRGSKGLLQGEMTKRFRDLYPDLVLVVKPCVVSSALSEALNNDGLQTVRLTKLDRSADRADAGKWVSNDTGAKLELCISAAARGKRLMSDLIQRRIGGDTGAFGQIVQFDGWTFETAKVEVELPNGSHRTFNIEELETGNAFTADIDPALDEDGELVPASVFLELVQVIEDTTG